MANLDGCNLFACRRYCHWDSTRCYLSSPGYLCLLVLIRVLLPMSMLQQGSGDEEGPTTKSATAAGQWTNRIADQKSGEMATRCTHPPSFFLLAFLFFFLVLQPHQHSRALPSIVRTHSTSSIHLDFCFLYIIFILVPVLASILVYWALGHPSGVRATL